MFEHLNFKLLVLWFQLCRILALTLKTNLLFVADSIEKMPSALKNAEPTIEIHRFINISLHVIIHCITM